MSEWVVSTVDSLGYWGIAFLMFLENVFPPIPSELIMPLAGFDAARGSLSLPGVVVAGTLGSVLGQLPLYYLGRWAGEARIKAWLERHGKWIGLQPDDIGRADRWFQKRGRATVFLCRLVPGVRSLISIPAGVARMNLPSFLLFSTLGMAIWTTVLAVLGAQLGEHYEQVEKYVGPASIIVLGCLASALIFRRLRHKVGRS